MGSKHEQRETRPMPGENDRSGSQSDWCVVAVHISVGKLHGRGVVSLRREQFDAMSMDARSILIETAVGGVIEEAMHLLMKEIQEYRMQPEAGSEEREVY